MGPSPITSRRMPTEPITLSRKIPIPFPEQRSLVMIDKVGSLAERVATSLSRRRFFVSMGRGGLALAAFLVGGLAAGKGKPPPPPPTVVSCTLNGGCCGGAFPYLRVDSAGRSSCSADASC